MDEEEAFQAALDAKPDCHVTRLVFADWLDERGDPRGPGYRAMGGLGVVPHNLFGNPHGLWWFCKAAAASGYGLPYEWFDRILHPFKDNSDIFPRAGYATRFPRREAEDAAAFAWAKLTPGQQEVILSRCLDVA
jgi:uncharacterized protein (TIGR02996 family)